MAENLSPGNNVVSGDFLRVLLALKQNVMKDTNVADVCQIKSMNTDVVICKSLCDDSSVQAVPLLDLNLHVNDIVCVLFTNYDFLSNLNKVKASRITQLTNDGPVHSKSGAIIIGKLYTTVEEGK